MEVLAPIPMHLKIPHRLANLTRPRLDGSDADAASEGFSIRGGWRWPVFILCLLCVFLVQPGFCDQAATDVIVLADLSLKELMHESVSSVSKRDQKLSEAPAAIYAISQEEIHRSGANTVAEALRLPIQTVSRYLRLDIRLGWQPTRKLEVRVGAMNLLEDQHAEVRGNSAPPTDVERSFYRKLT